MDYNSGVPILTDDIERCLFQRRCADSGGIECWMKSLQVNVGRKSAIRFKKYLF